jgi:hypothetical protein
VAFVAAVVLAEERTARGDQSIKLAGGGATGAFVVAALGTEGVIFTLREPSTALSSQLFPYIVAAGLVATGLGVWAARHWREFAPRPGSDSVL